MVYGIVSQLDDATTKAFFRSKKVADANVVFSTQLSVLVKVLKSGDIVYVVSVNRFGTVSQFLNFGRFCMANGVSSVVWGTRLHTMPYVAFYWF